jgi:hypothetical protein
MELDLITYGNPTQEQLKFLKEENYVDALFGELSGYKFPRNSSDATKEELNHIVDCLNTIQNFSGKEEYLKRYKGYDRQLRKFFKDHVITDVENKEELNELVDSIIDDTKGLLFKLKYFFQRPRPKQLAEYYKLKLFPYDSFTADTPSFPSGHSFQAKLLTEVLGNRYPKSYGAMTKIFDDISYSRLYLGLHYQSDIDVGIFCAEKVLQLKEFKDKFKL